MKWQPYEMIASVVAVEFRENFENKRADSPLAHPPSTPLTTPEARLPAAGPPDCTSRAEQPLAPPEKGTLKAPTSEIEYGGIFYQSASEVACGVLMQRYIKDFTVRQGETYEVPIGINHAGGTISIDFLVQGVLFEYHPPKFQKSGGDFSAKEYREYRLRLKNAASAEERKRIKADTSEILTAAYTRKRLQQIEASPDHKGMELVVAACPEELYSKIIKRFVQHPPQEETFLKEFRSLRAKVCKELAGRRAKSK